MATSPMYRACSSTPNHSTCRFCLCCLCPKVSSRPLSSILLRLAASAKTSHFLNICPGSLFSLIGWIERSLVLVCFSRSFLYVLCVRHFYAIFCTVLRVGGVGTDVKSWTYMISHIFFFPRILYTIFGRNANFLGAMEFEILIS